MDFSATLIEFKKVDPAEASKKATLPPETSSTPTPEVITKPATPVVEETKPVIDESKPNNDAATGNEAEPVAEEVVEKMIQINVIGSIRSGVFSDYLNRLGPTVGNKERHRVMMAISCYGGDVSASLAALDILSVWPQPTVVIAGGLNASAATLFIAHGSLRLAFANARFMLHDSVSVNDGTITQQEERLRNHKEERNLAMQVYQDYIGLTKKEVERIVFKDTYFNALQALELGTKGLIDGIILKLLDGFKYEILMRNGIRKIVDLHNDDFNQIKDLTVEAIKDQSIVEVNK